MMNVTTAVSVPSPRPLPKGEGDIVSLRDVNVNLQDQNIMTGTDIIATYETLSSLTGNMLNAAQKNDWDGLASLEQVCQTHIRKLTAFPALGALSAPQQQRKIEVIREILENDAQIRNLTEPRLAELQTILRGNSQRKSAATAYSHGMAM
jgi:flagellar protein FliT